MASLVKLVRSAIGAGPLDDPPACRPVLATSEDVQEPRTEAATAPPNNDIEKKAVAAVPVEAGTVAIEASQAIWGKKGRWLIIAG